MQQYTYWAMDNNGIIHTGIVHAIGKTTASIEAGRLLLGADDPATMATSNPDIFRVFATPSRSILVTIEHAS